MTETMEVIHGIRNITPGAIAAMATLVCVLSVTCIQTHHYHDSQAIWCLSGDDSLQKRGATTGIDYFVLCEEYLKLIMNGIHRDKVEFINIVQEWDEAIFPGTETSIVGRKTSADDENEIDREIERMDNEELDNVQ